MVGLFLIVLLGWWLLPVALRANSKKVLRWLSAPIYYGIDCANCSVAHLSLRAQSKEWLERKIVELSRELANERLLNGVATGGETIGKANATVKIRNIPGFRQIYGRILRRGETAWWNEITLSAGSDGGVCEGAAALCGDHLAGKISAATAGNCVAILLSDPRFRSIVHASGDGRPLVYEGIAQRGFSAPMGRICCVPSDMTASESTPLQIVTSSLSGTYPDGIALGTVSELRPSDDGIFQEGDVQLSPLLSSMRELTILVPLNR
ncbi:MAG: hypothetical protein LBB38_02895 [Puniceicoccales bacterium]|jgi:cell shape-determining protein MreC|nr:hypothetical protein [Puniceicoccales bacterium]